MTNGLNTNDGKLPPWQSRIGSVPKCGADDFVLLGLRVPVVDRVLEHDVVDPFV